MKKISLTDSYFDEIIGGVSRRAIANALISGRTVFPSKYRVFVSKTQNVLLAAILIGLTAVSTWTVAKWVIAEKTRNVVIQEIYSSGERATQEKKAAMFEKHGVGK